MITLGPAKARFPFLIIIFHLHIEQFKTRSKNLKKKYCRFFAKSYRICLVLQHIPPGRRRRLLYYALNLVKGTLSGAHGLELPLTYVGKDLNKLLNGARIPAIDQNSKLQPTSGFPNRGVETEWTHRRPLKLIAAPASYHHGSMPIDGITEFH